MKTIKDSKVNILPSFERISSNNHDSFKHLSINTFICTALAQHHGIPTRFLDWSLNPVKALFFAIYSMVNNIPPALIKFKNNTSLNISTINIVPYWTNDYFHRQEGVFTYTYPEEIFQFESIEQRVTRKVQEDSLEIYLINNDCISKIKEIINYEKLKLQLLPAYEKCSHIIFNK